MQSAEWTAQLVKGASCIMIAPPLRLSPSLQEYAHIIKYVASGMASRGASWPVAHSAESVTFKIAFELGARGVEGAHSMQMQESCSVLTSKGVS